MKKRILILDDDIRLAKSLARDFEDHDYIVDQATVIAEIKNNQIYDFAVVDVRLANGDFGLEAIAVILKKSPDCRILILSGYGSISTAVEAVKRGAVDYLTKPASFKEIELSLHGNKLNSAVEFKRLSLSQVEHEYIDFVLTRNQGNISKTAKDLGLHRQSLQRKLKKYT